ncbi:MAG: LysM peptidoglycan-binding domain-containing protein [Gammaproteobacteria bacterium]|nr:LysM peptidoglycan-binding domain-containing protein [Gammaproteobacteria bacterium]
MKKQFIALATLAALGGNPMAWADASNHAIGLQNSSLSATLQQYLDNGAFGTDPAVAAAQPGNVWQRIDNGLRLSDVSRVEVDKWRTWFLQHQGKLDQILGNARPFLYYVVNSVADRGLPMELALLPAIESGYNPKAYSPASAAGLWQFVPGTARNFGLQNTRWGDPRLSLTASTGAALDYLSYLYNYFGGNWLLAIAAYNAGQGTVSTAIAQNLAAGKPTDFWDLNLPQETENYVAELLALAQVLRNANAYHVALPDIPDQPHIAVITTPKSVDLNVAARLMDMPVAELQHLNAGLRYGVAPADYQLVVPTEKADTLQSALLTLPSSATATPAVTAVAAATPQPTLHSVALRRGETLWHLARRAGVTVAELKRWNHIRSARDLRAGETLRIYARGAATPAVYARNNDTLTVRPGETLSRVAQRAGVSVAELKRWNHIRSARDLQVGQSLSIHGGEKAVPVYTAARGTQKLQVRPGESLWQIAQRAGVGVSALARANHLTEKSVLHPGQTLRIPRTTAVAAISAREEHAASGGRTTTYVVRPGDTLWQIAQHYHVTPKSVIQWNRLASAADLQPGARLTIYGPH